MRRAFFTIIFGVIFIFTFLTNWYSLWSFALMATLLVLIVYKIGKGIVLLETSALFYVFTCLIMPYLGYRFYTVDNPLARLWIKFMPIPEKQYFSYALPAVAGFCLMLTFPALRSKAPDSGESLLKRIAAVKEKLSDGKNRGMQILVAGVAVSLILGYLPASLGYFATLVFFGSFAGLLYIYFSPSFRYKKGVMLLFILFIVSNAIQTGMFTVVAYMGITIFSFFQIGKNTSLISKLAVLATGIFLLIVLQNVKGTYRRETWRGEYEGSKLELFSSLFSNSFQKGSSLFSVKAFYPVYSRTNQGFNVALVMRRIPRIQEYDNGNRLLTVIASAFVPRFLWPDKPEAGGKFNMKYYAGYRIVGWSTNVGTMGEAYGSFGVTGGIIYMMLLGLMLRWVYIRVFLLSNRIPLLICWLPVLFYETTSSAETDTLQVINSIVKSAFFIWLLIKVLPQWFAINKSNPVRRERVLKYSQD